jgi:hypothetical protein
MSAPICASQRSTSQGRMTFPWVMTHHADFHRASKALHLVAPACAAGRGSLTSRRTVAIQHDRCQVIHFEVAENSTQFWLARQTCEAAPSWFVNPFHKPKWTPLQPPTNIVPARAVELRRILERHRGSGGYRRTTRERSRAKASRSSQESGRVGMEARESTHRGARGGYQQGRSCTKSEIVIASAAKGSK